jgi:putative CocE/NonD family hydrolase
MKHHAENEAARRGQRLLVTIGGHAGSGRKVGEVDFGASAEFNEDEITLAWYDYLFKRVANDFANPKPVRIFVMGTNQWRDEMEWPLARAQNTKYFLHSGGKANSGSGDGSLTTTAPRTEESDRYTYDPANPVPTIGGPLCCDAAHLSPGPHDQRPVEERADVLVYSTPPFTQDMEVTGPVYLEVFAKSSAPDTDFTAKLVDVWPNGFAQNLTEGIVRARYRNSQVKPELMNPGEIYKLTINLWSTSNVFLKGHRLRLEISSSNFPRFDRNLNTGQEAGASGKPMPATNTVYHDTAHPSALILPVVTNH